MVDVPGVSHPDDQNLGVKPMQLTAFYPCCGNVENSIVIVLAAIVLAAIAPHCPAAHHHPFHWFVTWLVTDLLWGPCSRAIPERYRPLPISTPVTPLPLLDPNPALMPGWHVRHTLM
jgi:hypothetical protein